MSYTTQAHELLTAFYHEADQRNYSWDMKPAELETARSLLQANPLLQIAVLRVALEQPPRHDHHYSWHAQRAVQGLLSQLCKRHLPYTLEDTQVLLRMLQQDYRHYYLPSQALLRALSRPLANPEILAACRPHIEGLREAVSSYYSSADQRRQLKLIDDLLGGQQERVIPLRPDAWGKQVEPLLHEIEPQTQEHWLALLQHCAAANGSTPTNKWLAETKRYIEPLEHETCVKLLCEWIGAFCKKYDERLEEENANLLKGLAWCCMELEDEHLAAILGDAAIEGYRKLPGIGPRAPRVAGACIYALKNMPGLDGAAQLERVRLNTKQATFLKGIEAALDEAARRASMSREDMEELTVPTFELQEGCRSVFIGEASVELRVVGARVQLQWFNAAGKPCKAAPANVKRDQKQALKDLKRLSDDMVHMLTAQRERIERLPLIERTWPLTTWRKRYLEHPLVGSIARHLIWRFTDGERICTGIWHEGHLVDMHDQPLQLTDETIVTLWHPVFSTAEEVLAWREWLEQHTITQPFKQAHREVYLLTDAERNTRVYSNRFAAHILRQHQFNSLAIGRGWRNKLRLAVDDSYPPATLSLSHWGLRAEFWVEGASDNYETDVNDTGTYLYLTTDQVRFYEIDAPENYAHASGGGYISNSWRGDDTAVPLALDQVPPLVFSEVLRDIDLFVGVASVGNDPTWQDGGPEGQYRDYWQSYSFGELSATAETRKQILERLIPRLSLAQRCHIEGRFLKVHGDLRTYKIHLGSGNILMEPNDQYLCIVPGRSVGTTQDLYLPFEGDTVLAIILSKAFLLAEDTKITDPTITSQIGKRKITLS
ncbi:hypothetical protein KSD_91630 [Ktedonobacter sp. SOSP1-85]|uniref:DUF4132 domain-containing protein n=1 Tax=Ktedonobacter sp. SOSP1-85 TaxID=2778367 RepID=UPI001915B12E|nr:DUF4132 domain-containing protein [Ktedonobacter sp. SOSP1-85]GHO81392.1 hypothetical protein KSD_91630 [Ktedonobacter sp. SOSP1-85]